MGYSEPTENSMSISMDHNNSTKDEIFEETEDTEVIMEASEEDVSVSAGVEEAAGVYRYDGDQPPTFQLRLSNDMDIILQ